RFEPFEEPADERACPGGRRVDGPLQFRCSASLLAGPPAGGIAHHDTDIRAIAQALLLERIDKPLRVHGFLNDACNGLAHKRLQCPWLQVLCPTRAHGTCGCVATWILATSAPAATSRTAAAWAWSAAASASAASSSHSSPIFLASTRAWRSMSPSRLRH